MEPLCEACDNEPPGGKAVCILCWGEPDGSLCAECEAADEDEDEDDRPNTPPNSTTKTKPRT